MPRYGYFCKNCNKESERVVKMDDRRNQLCECGELLDIEAVPSGVSFATCRIAAVCRGCKADFLPDPE